MAAFKRFASAILALASLMSFVSEPVSAAGELSLVCEIDRDDPRVLSAKVTNLSGRELTCDLVCRWRNTAGETLFIASSSAKISKDARSDVHGMGGSSTHPPVEIVGASYQCR